MKAIRYETFAKSMFLNSCKRQSAHVPLVRSANLVLQRPQNQSFL